MPRANLIWAAIAIGAIGFFLFYKREDINAVIVENSDNWTKYDALFQKYGSIYGVNWQWLKAICLNESSLGSAKSVAIGIENPNDIENSKSYDGKSWGIMQVTLSTAKSLDAAATEVKLNNPEYSIKLAAQLFKANMKVFSPSNARYVEMVVKSYNEGAGNAKSELAGLIKNPSWHAAVEEYWARWQRNLARVKNG